MISLRNRASLVTLGLFPVFATAVTAHAASIAPVFRTPVARAARTIAPWRQTSRRRDDAVGCSTNDTTAGDAFVGVYDSSAANVAAATYTAVLGGSSNQACDVASGVGAGDANIVGGAGFANDSFIAGGSFNQIESNSSFVGAGYGNDAEDEAFVGAGEFGFAEGHGSFVGAGGYGYSMTGTTVGHGDNVAAGSDSFIGAGDLGTISSNANGSFIGAGGYADATGGNATGNKITGVDSFIGAGDRNSIDATGAFVGGGTLNDITSQATDGVAVGGNANTVSGAYGAIGGGSGNRASGAFAIVPGGADNQALGAVSFAAGYHAKASHNGSFVWSDDVSGSGYATDGNSNEFIVRASGGTYFFSNEGESVGVKLASGSGTWSSTSDRNAKTDIVPLDDASILAKVDTLPVDAWQYKTERGVRHLGPMAQDFYAAFGAGEDDKHIASIDEDGVALAAIKALHRENARMQSQLAALAARNAELERRLDAVLAKPRG